MSRPIMRPLAILAVLLFVLASASFPAAQPTATRLQVHFINVAQADGILIMDDAKRCKIVIDSGESRSTASKQAFRKYLQEQIGATGDIDLVIASHPHSDHIGSMQWVLETYSVKNYIDSGHAYDSALYRNLMEVVEDQRRTQQLAYHAYGSVPASVETVCGTNGPQIKTLFPSAGLDRDVCEQNANNCSVVTKVTLGKMSFLFPGDAEEEQEELLLQDADVKKHLNSDVLKVAHHGSDTSSGEEFLEAVSPSWMVVSAGEKDVGTNKGYKHPRLSTVKTLLTFAGDKINDRTIDTYDATKKQWRRSHIWGRLFVTAKDGTVVLATDGTSVRRP